MTQQTRLVGYEPKYDYVNVPVQVATYAHTDITLEHVNVSVQVAYAHTHTHSLTHSLSLTHIKFECADVRVQVAPHTAGCYTCTHTNSNVNTHCCVET